MGLTILLNIHIQKSTDIQLSLKSIYTNYTQSREYSLLLRSTVLLYNFSPLLRSTVLLYNFSPVLRSTVLLYNFIPFLRSTVLVYDTLLLY
jgi:hypothetical protein